MPYLELILILKHHFEFIVEPTPKSHILRKKKSWSTIPNRGLNEKRWINLTMTYFSTHICTSNICLYDFQAANIFKSLTLEISVLLSMELNCIPTTFAYVVWFARLNPKMPLSKEQALCLLVNLLTSCTLDMKNVKNSLLGVCKNSFLFMWLNDM